MIHKPTQRLEYIETLRAFAALSVMFFHFICFSNGLPNDDGTQHFLFESETLRNNAVYGALGVQLFYIISGFVITYSLRRSGYRFIHFFKYMLKRILRIHPNYIAVICAIFLTSTILFHFFWGGSYWIDKKQALANITFTVDILNYFGGWNMQWINPVFKTLGVEFQFYIVIGLLFPFIDSNRIIRYSVLIIWMIFGSFTTDINSVMSNAPFFVIGYFLMDLYSNKEDLFAKLGLIVSLAILAIQYNNESFAIGIISIILIQFVRPNWWLTNKIGSYSYSLYLYHGLLGGTFLFMSTTSHRFTDSGFVLFLIAVLLSMLGSYIAYRLFEKPSMRWSGKISYRKPTES